jgi:hypothetical protein
MNKLDLIKQDCEDSQELETLIMEPVCALVDIEPDVLAQVAGGPDGSVLGYG